MVMSLILLMSGAIAITVYAIKAMEKKPVQKVNEPVQNDSTEGNNLNK